MAVQSDAPHGFYGDQVTTFNGEIETAFPIKVDRRFSNTKSIVASSGDSVTGRPKYRLIHSTQGVRIGKALAADLNNLQIAQAQAWRSAFGRCVAKGKLSPVGGTGKRDSRTLNYIKAPG